MRKRQAENLKAHIPDFFRSFALRMMREFSAFCFFLSGRKGPVLVLLLLLAANFVLPAQTISQAPIEAYRIRIGLPDFDSLLRLKPEHRILLLEKRSLTEIPQRDLPAYRQLVSDFRSYAIKNENLDGELLADLFDFYGFRIEFPYGTHLNRIIDYLEKLQKKAERVGRVWFLDEVGLLLAYVYVGDIRHYESGLFLLRELVARAEKTRDAASYRKQTIFLNLGQVYMSFNDQNNALVYFRKALNTKVLPVLKDVRLPVFLLNNLGVCFRELRQLDSSDKYYRQELALTRSLGDSVYEHIALGNLGENQYLRGKYDEAIPLLQADADMANKLGDFSLASNALILLGDIYTRKGQYRTADSLLSEGLRMTRLTQSYRRKKKAFPIMARYYLKTGQPELAAFFLDSSHFVSDSLVRLNNQSKISAVEADFAYQNLKIESNQEAADLRFSRLLLIGSLIFILMLSILGLLYFQRYRISARLRQLELQANLDAAENDLEAARHKLDEYLMQFSGPASADVNWTESRILTRENWLEFKKLFSASFPGFLENIPKKFPQLTEGEIRYCCLLRLNLKVKDIALILGVNENSAYRNRSRLLAKIDLPDDKALLDILLQP